MSKKETLRDFGRRLQMADQGPALRKERKALRRAKGDIVTMSVYQFDLNKYLNRGWSVLSNAQITDGVQKHTLTIDRQVLQERITRAFA